ncbi:uncharacterized protein LOC131029608 [Cryptomeria japonica]|uniref:uncharacterized protein LOC131029608 n=1 Tax=Cryptomeria japonica TaxID=3369 RepID=UPI0027DA8335|nr:uncharacterized protein LOC131029608 [Cryptomeria japonica]XP_057816141.2 uncharacterized protein LOC131029608 [Cryptomeria japonica]XP_057816142.2 uncharacterized protein LOC131029608 [Cryptomeria japonica]XP_057816143.2 uncharacterized protein LOC131029608 [Cryptomeria japonica]
MRDRGKTLEMYGGEESGLCCRKHPTQASGGICALCLKDKLSKLVCSDCGEQRPPSCSCSEAASSSSNNTTNKDIAKAAGTVDVGSAGRISFLIESDNVVDLRTGVVGGGQVQCDVKSRPAKPDAIVLLKRSKSVACTTTTPPPTTPPLVARTPPPLQSSLVTAALAGDSKVCASDNTAKRSSFWSFLYFIKSKPTSTKNNNNRNKKIDQPNHELVGSHRPADQGMVCSRPTKEEVAYKQQEVLCSRPTKQRLASRKAREPGLLDFVDEISPRTATLGVVNKRPTEHRSEQEIPSAHPVYESPLWMLPRLFRSRSVGCGRNSFSVDQDDISESGLKTEAKGHTSAYVDDKKAAMTKAKSKQAKSRSPRSVIVAATSADHMKIDKEERQAKAKRQLSVKPKGLFGGFGKSSATLYGISSVVSDDGNQISGASAGRSRGWGWAFSSPARIFKHKKPSRETSSNNNNGFMNQDTNMLSTSNSADTALKGE